MTAFSSAWSLLKNEPKPVYSVEDIRNLRQGMQSEKDTGIYDVNRGKTGLEQLMGIYPLQQQTFNPHTGEMSVMPYLNPEGIYDRFSRNYKERMDTSPRSSPAKVVGIPRIPFDDDYGEGIKYELQDEEGNVLSELRGSIVKPEDSKYGKGVENELQLLQNLHGNTPEEHQRKGYYQTLLNTILHNNMNILSSSRNRNSQPFHESFQRRLPPTIDFTDVNPELHRDHPYSRKYLYQPNRIKQLKEREKYRAAGYGDLLPDYGVVPMIDERDEKNVLIDYGIQDYPIQTQLGDKRFLPEYDVEHPRHKQHYPYFRTKDGEPYSTADVLQDLYNWEYSAHPYSRSLGELFG